MLECGHQILCIFVKSKTYFYAFMSDSSLVFLALFMNNLCISLFTNNLNRDPSVNLIIKDHVLTSFWFHLYLAHWHLWNRDRFNLFFFICTCSVSIFTLFSIFVLAFLGVLSISFGITILFGVLLREPHASHFAYSWKFQDACKTMWTTTMEIDLEGGKDDGISVGLIQ